MESRDDQRRGGGNPAPATTSIILSRSGAGYLGSYKKSDISIASSLETMNHASPALGIPLMGPDPRRKLVRTLVGEGAIKSG